MFNLRQKMLFKIVAWGIIFAFLPAEVCLARGHGKSRLGENIAVGVGISLIPMPTQNIGLNQVLMGQVVAPAVSYGLSEAGLDDPLANVAVTGGISGGISGGMGGGGFQGALVGATQWSAAGATSSYLQQEGLHPGLAGLGGGMAGQAAGGAMQGMLYEEDPYKYEVKDSRGNKVTTLTPEQVQKQDGIAQLEQQLRENQQSLTRTTTEQWAEKYESYKIESYEIETKGGKVNLRQQATASISPEKAKAYDIDKYYGVDLGAPEKSGNLLYRKQEYSGGQDSATLIKGQAELAKYDQAVRVVKTTSIYPTTSMGQGLFGGAWEALKAPGLSYYVGEGLRTGILQAGYDADTGETKEWAALGAPFIGDGARALTYQATTKKQLDGIAWYGYALGSLTRGAVSEGISHYLIEKNNVSPLAAGWLGNVATGAAGGALQYSFRQDGVSLGESIRQGVARGQFSVFEDFMSFDSPEQRFRGVDHGLLGSSLYAGRVLDFAQDTWLRKVKRRDGSIETETGFYYGDAVRRRIANLSISQAASNMGIPVRQVFADQFAIEGNYAEKFGEFNKDPRIPQEVKDSFITNAKVRREEYEKLGGKDWEQTTALSYRKYIKGISERSFGKIEKEFDYNIAAAIKQPLLEDTTVRGGGSLTSYKDYVANGGRTRDGRWFGPVNEAWYNANVLMLKNQPTTSRPTPLAEPAIKPAKGITSPPAPDNSVYYPVINVDPNTDSVSYEVLNVRPEDGNSGVGAGSEVGTFGGGGGGTFRGKGATGSW